MIEGLLALGVLVIVPLGVRLHPDLPGRWVGTVLAAGVVAVAGLFVEQGPVAAALAAVWFLFAAAAAVVSLARWAVSGSRSFKLQPDPHTFPAEPRCVGPDRSNRSRTHTPSGASVRRGGAVLELAWVAAPAYLAFGALWLVADRAAVEPAGIVAPFVLLTAVHFHYAGFVASLLAALVRARVGASAPRATAAAVVAVVGAPPVIAAGFAVLGVLQVVGAVVLTAGLFGLAWLTLRHVVPTAEDRAARVLLVVSSLAVLVPMLLAVQWAIGWNYGTPALSIPVMARTHGVVNAVGFSLCGVLGWLRLGMARGAS